MQLVVMIESGRAEAYRADVLELASPSGLRASRPLVFELVAGGWRGVTQIDGPDEDRDRDVALHLHALRELSRANPSWRVRIEIEPDGGVLELTAGSFGTDEDEVATLLRWTSTPTPRLDGKHDKLYVSVRLPVDAHQHFIDLVVRQLPASWPAPVTDASPDAIALGFELTGDAERTAQLISALRYAWLTEGSTAQALVELEGEAPIVCRIDDLRGWSELERQLRAAELDATPPWSAEAEVELEAPTVELARGAPLPALEARTLTWLDDRGRILALRADGVIRELAERVERVAGQRTTYWRRRDGAGSLRGAGRIDVPIEPGVERRVHGANREGVVITDRRGDDTRVRIVGNRGLRDGPVFRKVSAVALLDGFAFLVAEIGGHAALVTLDLASWGWDHAAPWPAHADVTDLAVFGTSELAIAANLDDAGALYIVAAFTGELVHAVYLPCSDPALVASSISLVWLVGSSAGGTRHDLLSVELTALTTTVVTAGIDATGWGPLHAARRGTAWLLAYAARGVFASRQAVVALPADHHITAIRTEPLLAVFTTGPDGSRLLLGEHPVATVELPTAAYEPLFDPR